MKKISNYFLELVVFVCGASLMILELVGSRVLAPYVGTSTVVWTSLIGIILGFLSLLSCIFISTLFYNLSSNLKNLYLEIKSSYTNDGKYLAVITKNGLWIKDKIGENTLIINSSFMDGNFLVENFITEFDDEFKVTKNIQSEKIDITKNTWVAEYAKIYVKNNYQVMNNYQIKTNFDSKRIKSLYSNLSALSLMELIELRRNYKNLNYSIIDIDIHLTKFYYIQFF